MPVPQALPASPPPAPPVPQAPPTGIATLTNVGTSVNTAFTLDQLKARRTELSNQLTSLIERRGNLTKEIVRTPADSRDGLQQVIAVLDARRVNLETDIATNGQLLLQARTDAAATATGVGAADSWLPSSVDVTSISVVFTLFVLCPIAVSLARLMWKRASHAPPPATTRESDLRLERVEQAVDAIAVQVERISEGQRFVTQLIARTDQQQPDAQLIDRQPAHARLGNAAPL